jgi:hypothetical protein
MRARLHDSERLCTSQTSGPGGLFVLLGAAAALGCSAGGSGRDEHSSTGASSSGGNLHNGIHVGVESLTGGKEGPFPSGCKSQPLTGQEKALELLLFDCRREERFVELVQKLEATPVQCVTTTTEEPKPPIVVQ